MPLSPVERLGFFDQSMALAKCLAVAEAQMLGENAVGEGWMMKMVIMMMTMMKMGKMKKISSYQRGATAFHLAYSVPFAGFLKGYSI